MATTDTGDNNKLPTDRATPYRRVQQGGSLCIALQPRERKILIVGGGNVAADRIFSSLNSTSSDPSTPTPSITVVCPKQDMCAEVKHRLEVESWNIHHIDRTFQDQDLKGVWLALVAIDNHDESRRIFELCRERRILVNVADRPECCDFYFGAMARRGLCQVMVSTQGGGPGVGTKIRNLIDQALPMSTGQAIQQVKLLRQTLREKYPGMDQQSIQNRMKWMSGICRQWSLEEMAQMDQDLRSKLIDIFLETAPSEADSNTTNSNNGPRIVTFHEVCQREKEEIQDQSSSSSSSSSLKSYWSALSTPSATLGYGLAIGGITGLLIGQGRLKQSVSRFLDH